MSKGKRVFSSSAYKGDLKSSIVIIEYINDDRTPMYYVNEFINNMKEGSKIGNSKNRVGKSSSSERAHDIAKEAINDREFDGWTTTNSIFGDIQEKSEQQKINEFLDKYGG